LSKLVVRKGSGQLAELVAPELCAHDRVHEIGTDFDKDGMLLRLVRCQECGLVMRQYLPMA
jgi:uncharacterized Zn finger protein